MSDKPDNDLRTKAMSPPLGSGHSLKHYRLEGILGEGGMGLVYRGRDTKLNRTVAVKLLSASLTADPDKKQRLLQEARAAARVSHPAIAQVFDADEQEGVTFIVMELVEGKTVRELIRNKELDLMGAMDIAIQVAEGLAKAHELGIVHRDIKPANIMLTPDGHAKILDFGLAKLMDYDPGRAPGGVHPGAAPQTLQTQPGVVLGTPAYMSPEQIRGNPIDFRSDIFSLGVLIYEMVTGQSPFQRENLMDSLHAVAFDDTPPMSTPVVAVPPELQRIVARCLKKQAQDRYPSARMLAQELRRLRRDTDAGLAQKTSWRQRMIETWEQMQRIPPSRYAWFGAGVIGFGLALYLSLSRISTGSLIFLVLGALYLYHHIRNRPQRVQDLFVSRVAKIPEVRLIVFQSPQFTVVVDRSVAQLYGRINRHLSACNRKLYHGQPMTVSIQQEVLSDQLQKYLAGPGVQYVREDVLADKAPQTNLDSV